MTHRPYTRYVVYDTHIYLGLKIQRITAKTKGMLRLERRENTHQSVRSCIWSDLSFSAVLLNYVNSEMSE